MALISALILLYSFYWLGIGVFLTSGSLNCKIRLFNWNLYFQNVGRYHYKLSLELLLLPLLVLVWCVSIFICLKIHFDLPFDFFVWPLGCLGACYFTFTKLEFSSFLLVVNFWFHITVVRKEALCDFSTLIKVIKTCVVV